MLPNYLTLTKRDTIYTACLLLILSKAQSTQQATPPTTPASPQAHRVKIDSYEVLKTIVVDQYKSKKMSQDVYDIFLKILPQHLGNGKGSSYLDEAQAGYDIDEEQVGYDINVLEDIATSKYRMYDAYFYHNYRWVALIASFVFFLIFIFILTTIYQAKGRDSSEIRAHEIIAQISLILSLIFYATIRVGYYFIAKRSQKHTEMIQNDPDIQRYATAWHYLKTLDPIKHKDSVGRVTYSVAWTPSTQAPQHMTTN